MNRNKLAKKTAPLILVPLCYIGAVLIHGSHPPIHELLWTIIFIALVSLPVGYLGLFCIVLPIEKALKNKNRLSNIKLIILSSICGGILFFFLSLSLPKTDHFKILAVILVFSMGFTLALFVSLSYCLISGTIKKSFLPLVLVSIVTFFYLVYKSPEILQNLVYVYKHITIKKIVSNTNIKELTLKSCDIGNCVYVYDNTTQKTKLEVRGFDNSKSKTELIKLIFTNWPVNASHCEHIYKSEDGTISSCWIY